MLGDSGERYAIDLDPCKDCDTCVAECPCGSIRMEPEEI
jgi:Pyruvate/2-oxoacid:ferredoxin oxidoreductase delta subunit